MMKFINGSMKIKSEQATTASGATGQLEGLREVGPEVIQWGKQSGAGGVSYGQLGALEKGGNPKRNTKKFIKMFSSNRLDDDSYDVRVWYLDLMEHLIVE